MKKNIAIGCAAALPVVFFAWLLYQDALPTGTYAVSLDVTKSQPVMSRLYPEGRVGIEQGNNEKPYAVLSGEPVYFDVRLPRRLSSATVRILYASSVPLGLGVALPPTPNEPWRYEIKKLMPIDGSAPQSADLTFSLAEALVSKNRVRFIISAPNFSMVSVRPAIHSIRVNFAGEALSLSVVQSWLGRLIAR
ncbi:MAG: hypothetical protein WC817_04250 [Patescibacteria group bacterium]|jgi:hypothetical protein